ncbi:MAG: RNA recognition motif domain-containing protein [Candidatus Kapaibacteriota bacterium]
MNIYVANIPFKASEDELRGLFEEFGQVDSARIITDKFTQRSRGFGFIEMPDETNAKNAIESLNGSDFMGKALVVNEAKPRTENTFERGNRGGGGYNRSSYRN